MPMPRTLVVITLMPLALLLTAPGAAHASSDGVERHGSCSGSTDWKIKAKHDDGRIEVEAEIDSNHNGQAWRWRLRHDGKVVARGSSTTHRPSGSFEVERRTANHAGVDRFALRAVHGGEVCVARVRL